MNASPNATERLRRGAATRSAEETRALAADFARELPPDATLALSGDLGVGKTTFIQGLARGLGIEAPVASPTFTVYTIHRTPAGPAGRPVTLLHLDAYRLAGPEQLDDLLIDDFLVSPYCLAVEWPERIAGWLPETALWLDLAIGAGGRHRVQLR